MSTPNFKVLVFIINIAMASIDPNIIRQIGEAIGKSIAKEISNSISAQMTKQNVTERTGRGGDSNRQSPEKVSRLSGSGEVKAVKDLRHSIEDLKDSMKPFGGKLDNLGESIKKNLSYAFNPREGMAAYQQSKLDSMTLQAEDMRDKQDTDSIYYKLASSAIDYIKASGTDISKLKSAPEKFEEQRKLVHKLSQDMDEASKSSQELGIQFNNVVKFINEMSDNGLDIMGEFDEEAKAIFAEMVKNGVEVDKTTERYKDQQKVLAGMSDVYKDSAGIVSEVTQSVANNYTEMAKNQSRQMMGALGYAFSALTFGVGQVINDWVRSFDYLQPASVDLKWAATVMGMSMRELQEGMMQYRDVLRSEAILAGGSMFDGDMIRNIQNMGNSIGLTGTEAFNFGMRMRETSTRLGMSAQASEDSYATMMDFYKQGALAMNMTVSEFGDYMNELSSDPAFVGLSNIIRAQGGDVQASLANEIKLRARTNRLLGLSNEQIKEQIMLENAKRWAPITERYQSEVQGNLLVRQLERMSGLDLSPEAEAAFKQFNFDPKMMNDAQRELMATEVRPFLATAQGMYNEGLAKASADMTREQALAFSRRQAVPQELVRLFASNSGMMEYLQKSEVVMAQLERVIAGTNFTREDVLAAISGGMERNEQNAELFDRIDKVMGLGAEEQAQVRAPTERMEVVVKAMDIFKGSVMGGLTKIIGGVFAILGILSKGILLRRLGLNSLRGVGTGLFGGARTAGGAAGPLGNAGRSAITLDKGITRLTSSLIGKAGLLGALTFAGLEMWNLGTAAGKAMAGTKLMQAVYNSDWLANFQDKTSQLLGFTEAINNNADENYGVSNEQAADARRNRLLARLDRGQYTAGYTTVAEIQKMTADELAKATKEIIDYNQKKIEEAEVTEQVGATGKSEIEILEEINQTAKEQRDKTNELVVHERDKKEANNNAQSRIAEAQRVAAANALGWQDRVNSHISAAEQDYSLHRS